MGIVADKLTHLIGRKWQLDLPSSQLPTEALSFSDSWAMYEFSSVTKGWNSAEVFCNTKTSCTDIHNAIPVCEELTHLKRP